MIGRASGARGIIRPRCSNGRTDRGRAQAGLVPPGSHAGLPEGDQPGRAQRGLAAPAACGAVPIRRNGPECLRRLKTNPPWCGPRPWKTWRTFPVRISPRFCWPGWPMKAAWCASRRLKRFWPTPNGCLTPVSRLIIKGRPGSWARSCKPGPIVGKPIRRGQLPYGDRPERPGPEGLPGCAAAQSPGGSSPGGLAKAHAGMGRVNEAERQLKLALPLIPKTPG